MKNVIVKKVSIENFKGIKSRVIEFNDELTEIVGKNGSGKTSVQDAIWWCLFNKNSSGDERFNVRPLDKDGNKVHNIVISVELDLMVDGNLVQLKKVQEENWVLHRGSINPTLEGNPNSFWVDGYPMKSRDFDAKVASIVDMETFKMLSDPRYMVSLPWKKQREILMKMYSEKSDAEIAREADEDFSLIEGELEKAPNVDVIRAKFTKTMNELKKRAAEIPVRVDEANKQRVEIPEGFIMEAMSRRSEIDGEIKHIEARIAEKKTLIEKARTEALSLEFEVNDMRRKSNDEALAKKTDLEKRKAEILSMIERKESEIKNLEERKEDTLERIKETKERNEHLGEKYKEVKESVHTFRRTEPSKDDFVLTDTKCKTCGQELPKGRIEQLNKELEYKYKQAVKKHAEQVAEDVKFFEEKKMSELKRLIEEGNRNKSSIEASTKRVEDIDKRIFDTKLEVNTCKDKLEEVDYELEHNTSVVVDPTTREKLDSALAKLKSAKTRITSHTRELEELDNPDKKDALNAELTTIITKLAAVDINRDIDKRIRILEEEQRDIAQMIADQERRIYYLEKFIKYKLDRISAEVNKTFKVVNFKLFNVQQNGGVAECCEATVNGVPMSDLNSGHKIRAGLDIVNTLGNFYEIKVPVFVDNAESISERDSVDCGSQIIAMVVTEGEFEVK